MEHAPEGDSTGLCEGPVVAVIPVKDVELDSKIIVAAKKLVSSKAEARVHKANLENTNRRILDLEIELSSAIERSGSHTL